MRKIQEFDEFSAFLECSTNSTPTISALKKYIDYLSAFGYTHLYLGLTDCYKIKGEPYFNFGRAGYTTEQFREVDAYAAEKGIELRANVQVLAHMPFMYQWDCYKHLYDTQEAFMVGKEEVYQFVDKILATMSEAIKSRTIHIGMDEAWELGMGQYRVKNGFTEKRDLLLTHLQRVVEIAKKYDYTCEIWSDMFYRIVEGSDFDDDGVIPDDVRESIPEGVHLVHWKYEHQETEIVRRQIKQNQAICDDVTFAGCAWKSMGLAPNNQYSIDVMENQLKICREEGVRRYIVTIWSDCGAHCSMFSILPSLFAATEMARGKSKEEIDKEMFQEIVGVAFDDFMMLDYMNNPFYKETATLNSRCYWGLMSDVLLGSFDLYLDEHTNEAYEKLVEKYESISAGDFGLLFNDFTLYARVLSIKMNLGVRLRRAYREGNKKLLRQYATVDIPKMISYMELYIDNFEKRWMTENMAFALEVHHLYYGGQIERWQYVAERVLQHLEDGNPIEEIEREELPPSLFSEGSEDTLFVLGYERLLSYSEYGR